MVKLVTTHASSRIKERVGNIRNNSLLRIVLDNGKSKAEYKGKLFQYMNNKELQKSAKVKVYNNNLYVLSKNTKRLITTYPLPEKYLPTERYEYDNHEKEILNFINRNNDFQIKIITYDNYEYQGKPKFIKNKTRLQFVLEEENDKIIRLNEIKRLESVYEILNIEE